MLAAGGGTRFGAGASATTSTTKLLAELGGRPLLQYAIDAQCEVAELERVVVVLGAAADQVLQRVELGRAEAVLCEEWAEGQSASLRRGIEALDGTDKAIVTLGDAPLITPEVIRLFRRGAGRDARKLRRPPRTPRWCSGPSSSPPSPACEATRGRGGCCEAG